MLLVSLDLSAAFDMVEHATLLKRLSCSFGVSGAAYYWIRFYLDDRTQSVRIGSYSSAVTSCPVGVPQGSVLSRPTAVTSKIVHLFRGYLQGCLLTSLLALISPKTNTVSKS